MIGTIGGLLGVAAPAETTSVAIPKPVAMPHSATPIGQHFYTPQGAIPNAPQGQHFYTPQGENFYNQRQAEIAAAQQAQQQALANALRTNSPDTSFAGRFKAFGLGNG